jgi:hypothetical protein
MKNVEPLDAAPTVFGGIAIVGGLMSRSASGRSMGQMLLVIGGLLALATALASLLSVSRRKALAQEVVVVNTVWVLVVVGEFVLIVYQLSRAFNFRF